MKTFFLTLFFPLFSFGVTLEEKDFLGVIEVFHDDGPAIEGQLTVSKNPNAGPWSMQLIMKIELQVGNRIVKRICPAHYAPRFKTLDGDCYKQAGEPDFKVQIVVAPQDVTKFAEHKWASAKLKVFQSRHMTRGFRYEVHAEVRKN